MKELLTKWAEIEPDRCRIRDNGEISVQYEGIWRTVIDYYGDAHYRVGQAVADRIHERGWELVATPIQYKGTFAYEARVTVFPKNYQVIMGTSLESGIDRAILQAYLNIIINEKGL